MKEVKNIIVLAYRITILLTVLYFTLFIATLVTQSLMLSFLSTLIVIINLILNRKLIKKYGQLVVNEDTAISKQICEMSKSDYIPTIIIVGLTTILYSIAVTNRTFMMDNMFSFHGYQIIGQVLIFQKIKELNSKTTL